MNYGRFIGLLIASVAIFMLISPVMACPAAPTVTKNCPAEVCSNCPMTCTITATFYGGHGSYTGKVVDLLPAGVTDVTSSDSGIYTNGVSPKVTWNLPVTNAGLTKELTVTFKPLPGSFINSAQASAISTEWITVVGKSVGSGFHASTCTPEFPSGILPATLIVGLLGVILYIQRTKE
jgi:hypothetical protein